MALGTSTASGPLQPMAPAPYAASGTSSGTQHAASTQHAAPAHPGAADEAQKLDPIHLMRLYPDAFAKGGYDAAAALAFAQAKQTAEAGAKVEASQQEVVKSFDERFKE